MKGLRYGVAAFLVLACVQAWAQEGNQAADLLTATPWCSFAQDKATGHNSTTRYQFFGDGTYGVGVKSEGYLSGAGGSFASQRDRTSGGHWQLRGNALFLTANRVTRGPAHLSIKTDYSGGPVIVVDGVEFSPCK